MAEVEITRTEENQRKLIRSKATMAVTISLMNEIIEMTVGKSMPNNLYIQDVEQISASALSSNLLV